MAKSEGFPTPFCALQYFRSSCVPDAGPSGLCYVFVVGAWQCTELESGLRLLLPLPAVGSNRSTPVPSFCSMCLESGLA